MSFFEAHPSSLPDEKVSEWLARTKEARELGWSLSHSCRLLPPDRFLIDEWIDPAVSPLPKSKEHIWGASKIECYSGLVQGRHVRAAVTLPPLSDVHDLAVVVDVRSPLAFLEQSFKNAVLAHREKLQSLNRLKKIEVYDGKPTINSGGIYDKYIQILQRLNDGESEDEVLHKESVNGRWLPYGEACVDQKKTQIPKAIALRDGGYADIAHRDDFVGELKPSNKIGNIR